MILTKFVEKSRINTVNLSEKCSTSGEHSEVSDISDISDISDQLLTLFSKRLMLRSSSHNLIAIKIDCTGSQ